MLPQGTVGSRADDSCGLPDQSGDRRPDLRTPEAHGHTGNRSVAGPAIPAVHLPALRRQHGPPTDRGNAVTRSIITAAEWTLGLETAEEAPKGIYSAECVTCGAQAQPTDDERLPVEVWALKHTGLNPSHRQFKATVESFWRVTPAPGNPYRAAGTRDG